MVVVFVSSDMVSHLSCVCFDAFQTHCQCGLDHVRNVEHEHPGLEPPGCFCMLRSVPCFAPRIRSCEIEVNPTMQGLGPQFIFHHCIFHQDVVTQVCCDDWSQTMSHGGQTPHDQVLQILNGELTWRIVERNLRAGEVTLALHRSPTHRGAHPYLVLTVGGANRTPCLQGAIGSWVLFRNGLLAVCEHTSTVTHRDTFRG